ncbi:hypothetical protein DYB30_008659 [Aphanomyces astaci]|uniref:Uncharacterized protein n=1 Tax=Aphanomyces astaci TaxID=112090 RepID=A0A397EDB0_APHAT|nr:hypothetical protein DYB30_008659 [Aphanomyces astaci]
MSTPTTDPPRPHQLPRRSVPSILSMGICALRRLLVTADDVGYLHAHVGCFKEGMHADAVAQRIRRDIPLRAPVGLSGGTLRQQRQYTPQPPIQGLDRYKQVVKSIDGVLDWLPLSVLHVVISLTAGLLQRMYALNLIREVWLQERREQEQEQQQLEFMLQQAEFQESDTESDLEFEDNEDIDDDDGDQHKPVMDAVAARAKERMVHLNPKARAILEQQLERRAKAKLIAAKKRHDFAHRLNEEYMVAAAETMFAVANADLTIVQMQEKLAYFQRLDSDADQIKRMQLDLKRNQQQAKEITDGARRKHEYAAALELAIAREKRDEKVMHKTIKDTAYMDSSVLHKRCQRFLTDYLAKELYKYSDAQNTRFSCVYHPAKYDRACGAFGSTGCKRRFHVPVRDDPVVAANVQVAEAQEKVKMDTINDELVELEGKSVARTVLHQVRDRLQDIQDDLATKRTKAARYDQFHTTS